MALAIAGDAIHALLAAASGVTALVGTRIYPDEMQQGDPLPAVVYVEAEFDHVRSLSGRSGTAMPTYSVECLGNTRKEARALAAVVRTALSDVSRTTSAGVFVQWIKVGTEHEDTTSIELQDGSSRFAKRKTLDVTVWHNE